jgi:hypothetical protein
LQSDVIRAFFDFAFPKCVRHVFAPTNS